jgi:uncharacterized membrane protein
MARSELEEVAKSLTAPKRRKRSPIRALLLKGLGVLLPALITIAVFFWAWGVIRDYAIETVIRVVDSAKWFNGPDDLYKPAGISTVTFAEVARVSDQDQYWVTPDRMVYRQPAGRRGPADPEHEGTTPKTRVVYLDPDGDYSVLQVVSAYLNQQRHYDYGIGSVRTYTVSEYVIAVIVTVVLIILIGFFTRNIIGRQLVSTTDRVMKRVPVVNLVYPYAKQVVDFFFSEQKQREFDHVVAVEWPREGCYQLGFVTSDGLKTLTTQTGHAYTTVFIPMSPLPMTGFTVFVPADQVEQVDLSVEDAVMVILSGGVLTPPDQQGAGLKKGDGEEANAEWQRRIDAARTERVRLNPPDEDREGRKSERDIKPEGRNDPKKGDTPSSDDKPDGS